MYSYHASQSQRLQGLTASSSSAVTRVPTTTTHDPFNFLGDSSTPPKFIKTLSTINLLSYTAIAIMTACPSLVKLSTKIMRYMPTALIKMFVYPIYCGGEHYAEVVNTGSKLLQRGFGNMMISYTVEDAEGASSPAGSSSSSSLLDSAVGEIIVSIDQISVRHYDNVYNQHAAGKTKTRPISGYIALKPTGLMSNAAILLKNHDNPEYANKWADYLAQCRQICQHAANINTNANISNKGNNNNKGKGNNKVVIVFDAEKRALQSGVYAAQRAMMREFNRNGHIVVMGTIQMYLQDSLAQLEDDLAHAKKHDYQLAIKLVRGAYIHSEPDRWAVIHKTKAETDTYYNHALSILLDSITDGWKNPKIGPLSRGLPLVGRVIVASHNKESMSIVDRQLRSEGEVIGSSGTKDLNLWAQDESVVFGQLMGMAEDQGEELANHGYNVIKYVPWGPTKETKNYLVRRLEENGDTVNMGGWKLVKFSLAEFGRRMHEKASFFQT